MVCAGLAQEMGFSIIALTVVGAAAQGRLVYSMARDNMLPFSGFLKRVNSKTKTPIFAMLSMLGVGIGFLEWGYLKGSGAFAALVVATATLPFVVYLLTMFAYAVKREKLESVPGAFNLGRWAKPVQWASLAWVVVALAVLTLPHEFRNADYATLVVLGLAFVWWATVLRGRLARGEAGVTPVTEEMMEAPSASEMPAAPVG